MCAAKVAADPSTPASAGESKSRKAIADLLAVDRLGIVYVLLVVIGLFSAMEPELFPTFTTARTVLNQSAIIALVSLALIVPMASGVFDLSIGNVMALSSVVTAELVVNAGLPVPAAVGVTLILATLVGFINIVLVVKVGINSFIATLGSGAVISAFVLLVSNNQTVTSARLNTGAGRLAYTSVGGITVPVIVALFFALLIWWLLEHTATGRRVYATGFNVEAARLAGVRAARLRSGALLLSALMAGVGGVLVTARVGAGSPDIAPLYLLDAFAIAFLGATQIRPGRFNALGTVLAVLLIGTGNAGLSLIGAPAWILSLFTGVALIVALVLAQYEREASM